LTQQLSERIDRIVALLDSKKGEDIQVFDMEDREYKKQEEELEQEVENGDKN